VLGRTDLDPADRRTDLQCHRTGGQQPFFMGPDGQGERPSGRVAANQRDSTSRSTPDGAEVSSSSRLVRSATTWVAP
jgi:hypothetical protein